jgi:Fe-S cluster biosynthesis and repair protein YggX
MTNIYCQLLKKNAESLSRTPIPGPIGDYILDHISQEAWQLWLNHQVKLINEYRLSLAKKEDRERLHKEMIDFFNIKT